MKTVANKSRDDLNSSAKRKKDIMQRPCLPYYS